MRRPQRLTVPRLPITAARRLIVVAIALLILGHVASWLGTMLGTIPALVGIILMLAVQWVCSRWAAAHVKYYIYLYIPTVLFTALPAALKVYFLLKGRGQPLVLRLWGLLPIVIGFVAPVFLLLIVWGFLGEGETRSDPSQES